VASKIIVRSKTSAVGWWFLFALVIALTAFIRIRLLEIPLERDEGEYAYGGQLLLQGIPPYQLLYSLKFPGIYAAYALIMSVFGQTIGGIHFGLLLVNASSVLFLFFIGRRLLNSIAGMAAAASYAVLSLQPSVLGLAAHATQFVVASTLGATTLLLRPSGRQPLKILFASGFLFGIAVLMKQPALFFVLFGAIYLLFRDRRDRLNFNQKLIRQATFAGGVMAPLAITCFLLWRAGVFQKFWFWTIDYARHYGASQQLSDAVPIFIHAFARIFSTTWLLWIMAASGLWSVLREQHLQRHAFFLIGFLLFSFAAICPGFYFREHYFVLLLPPISLLVGVAAAADSQPFGRGWLRFLSLRLLLSTAALTLAFLAEPELFFSLSPKAACWRIYGVNPFPDSIDVAKYIEDHTSSGDTVAVAGSEPQIYFYSHRHSATGFIYLYDLMAIQPYARQMQREMINEIERARPEYLVLVSDNESWLETPQSEVLFLDWLTPYCQENFAIEGLVNILSSDRSDIYFPCTGAPSDLSSCYMTVYRRKH
jgi:4-amino-4-deoxy-L-arabinose transferase-like glycosyltransferase